MIVVLCMLQVTVCVCAASCLILWLAPQVPYSEVYNGGAYIHYPALLLAATALVSALSLFPGSCGLSRDSKAALTVVRVSLNTAIPKYRSGHCSSQYCVMLVVVSAGELVGSGTMFTFTYIGKVTYEYPPVTDSLLIVVFVLEV